MNRRGFAIGSLSAAGLFLSACQTASRQEGQLTASLQPGYRPEPNNLEAGLWKQIEKIEQQIKTSPHRVRDPALDTYVSDLACRLGDGYCKDVRTYVVRTPHFNAFMYPNGCLVLWSGLLLRTQNEAQLSAVIGHEIGHYLLRHSLHRFEALKDTTNALAFLGLGLGVVGLGAFGDLAALMAIAGNQAYSRDQEREADEKGLELAARLGLAPTEASRLWETVVAEHEAAENKTQRDFLFASHPAGEERMATLARMAEEKAAPAGGWTTGADRFDAVLGPHRSWLLSDEVRLRRPGPTLVLLDRLIGAAPQDGELLFYKGEVLRLRERDGDADLALAEYDKAIAATGAPPDVYRSRGLIALKKGDRAGADAAFRSYLEKRPDAEDRMMIESYLSRGV